MTVETKELPTANDYRFAYDAQCACNLSGIVFEFARVMQRICNQANAEGRGTDWKNSHPIARMYAEQIMHLTSACSYSDAYRECRERGGV